MSEQDVGVHVCIFLFDVLLLRGEVLLQKTFRERRCALCRVFTALKPGYVELAQSYELRILPGAPEESQGKQGQAASELPVAQASSCSTDEPNTEVKTLSVRTAPCLSTSSTHCTVSVHVGLHVLLGLYETVTSCK